MKKEPLAQVNITLTFSFTTDQISKVAHEPTFLAKKQQQMPVVPTFRRRVEGKKELKLSTHLSEIEL